ncbi:hypothetical protein [Legionella clemsonensis]|uniref:Uncharacterized protein n=1 Tax=Legionella clemsonensis TaxID=1867846 RepID=A0A222NYB7_9GAMM|nr:hypothetical protein [Legionella clemsonensis]ASQ44580.1 hypothetical protein clem_00065 [Legionella clemsonensis]
MPGYKRLNYTLTEKLLESSINQLAQYSPETPIKTVTQEEFNTAVEREDVYINPFKYYTHPTINLIIITTPIAANNFAYLLPHLGTLFPGKQLLLGLDGQGATEQHIVTTYVSADQQTIEIFDPKASNAKRFFSGEGGIATLLLGVLRALSPFPKTHLSLAETTANYYTLGTQSFFDDVSCGYHNVANILACKELLEENSAITRKKLIEKTKNPVSEVAKLLKKNAPPKIDNKFASFVKKAWQDTMMPLASKEQRNSLKFQHYFLGWPYEGTTSQKVIYFLSLRFIFQPTINLIRRPIELMFNLLSETANFLKNSLINWAPTYLFTQYLRSSLLLLNAAFQGIFKTFYLVLRTFTSPLVTLELLQAKNNLHATKNTSGTIAASPAMSAPILTSEKKLSSGSNVITLFEEKGINSASSKNLAKEDEVKMVMEQENDASDGLTVIEHPESGSASSQGTPLDDSKKKNRDQVLVLESKPLIF